MAIHIKADGTITIVEPKQDGRFTVDELQTFVGGYIELVKIRHSATYGLVTVHNGDYMFVNEDGIRLNLPINRTASAIYSSQIHPVVGDVLITHHWEVD